MSRNSCVLRVSTHYVALVLFSSAVLAQGTKTWDAAFTGEVLATSPRPGGGVAALFESASVAALDENGDVEWQTALSAPLESLSNATGELLGIGPNEEIYACVLQGGASHLARFDRAGAIVWSRPLLPAVTPFHGGSYFRCQLAVDAAGEITVVGTAGRGPFGDEFFTAVLRFDDAGNELWRTAEFGAHRVRLVVDPASGVVTIAGTRSEYTPAPEEITVRRYASSGALLWNVDPTTSVPWTGSKSLTHLAVDAGGACFALYRADSPIGGPNAVVLARVLGGALTWTREWPAATGVERIPHGLGVDAAGNVTVAVRSETGAAASGDVRTTRLDAAGTVLWDEVEAGDFVVQSLLRSERNLVVHPDGTTTLTLVEAVRNLPPGTLAGSRLVAHLRDASGGGLSVLELAPNSVGVVIGLRGAVLDARGNALVRHDRTLTQVVPGAPLGATYCSPAVPNSTGSAATLAAVGSDVVAADNVTLFASQLPASATTLMLVSTQAGFVAGPGGSQGDLCLGGAIGRFLRPGELRRSTVEGTASLQLTLGDLPSPTGAVAASAGQTWRFQAWYRDANPSATSNFTDAVALTLQ